MEPTCVGTGGSGAGACELVSTAAAATRGAGRGGVGKAKDAAVLQEHSDPGATRPGYQPWPGPGLGAFSLLCCEVVAQGLPSAASPLPLDRGLFREAAGRPAIAPDACSSSTNLGPCDRAAARSGRLEEGKTLSETAGRSLTRAARPLISSPTSSATSSKRISAVLMASCLFACRSNHL